jgi:tetratricopeptide (TPR) repeat protein
VDAAITRYIELLEIEPSDRMAVANIRVFLGGLVAQRGNFEEARELINDAIATYDDYGQRTQSAIYGDVILSEVELLADDVIAAERVLRRLCGELAQAGAYSHLASRAGDLAEALYRQGHLDAAAEWVATAEAHSAADDLDAMILWMPVRAKITARRGALHEAKMLGRNAVGRAEETDALNRRGKAQLDLGEVLYLADRVEEAREAIGAALRLYEEKGNLVGAARSREVFEDVALV